MGNLRNVILGAFILFVIWSCDSGRNKGEKYLSAPLTKNAISNIVEKGIDKNKLFERCGKPYRTEKRGNIEKMEFAVSMENMPPSGTNNWMIESIVVTVSNDIVVSWDVLGRGRVY